MATEYKITISMDLTRAYGRRIMQSIVRFAHEAGNWRIAPDPSHRITEQINNCDGAIVQISTFEIARSLKGLQIPIVNISNAISGLHYPKVINDDSEISIMAAKYWLDRGYSRFGFVGDPVPRLWSLLRGRTMDAYLQNKGFQCLHLYPLDTPEAKDDKLIWDEQKLGQWLKELPKPIALTAANNTTGRMILDCCKQSGLAVPDDIAVLGIDNNDLLCETAEPPLSGLALDNQSQGYEAAQMLDNLMNRRPLNNELILIKPLDIVTRASSDVLATDDDDVTDALRFIWKNVRHCIKVSAILDEVPVSRRSLERKFRKELGHSIRDEIIRSRISVAKKTLAETDYAMTRIASISGFADAKQLSTIFKAQVGMTPTDYRKKFRTA